MSDIFFVHESDRDAGYEVWSNYYDAPIEIFSSFEEAETMSNKWNRDFASLQTSLARIHRIKRKTALFRGWLDSDYTFKDK